MANIIDNNDVNSKIYTPKVKSGEEIIFVQHAV